MQIKFCGADKNVTGSRHLLTVNTNNILLDCGLMQGGTKEENYANNNTFLFKPDEVHSVVLSHAHIDHSGNLPNLVKQGFTGKIHCTKPTVELCRVMLEDTAHILEQDADFLMQHFREDAKPLYTKEDVNHAMNLFVGHDYGEEFEVSPGLKVTFYDAGHVFGSAQVMAKIKEKNTETTLVFTGDLGRKYMPILNDPYQIPEADILITESTYASHIHDSFQNAFDEIEWIIKDVIGRGGKIIIPGFALERTQELVYVLHKLHDAKKIPEVPIYVDSPLSTKISEVFMHYTKYYDNEAFKEFLSNAESPFSFKNLHYITSSEQSKKLNNNPEPCIIIAASGMCTGGRILHHLKYAVSNPKNLILVVGYMAQNTLGRDIVEKKRKLKIFNEWFDLRADVEILNEFSAHADKLELLDNVRKIKGLSKIFIVHGEEQETAVMRDNIYNDLKFKGEVKIPALGQSFEIVDGNLTDLGGEVPFVASKRVPEEGE